jgi:hypothetical protein
VPGWPTGFGSKDKARASLQAAQHALSAPPRPGREVADNGRRAEARALIAKLGGKAGG